MKKFLRVKMSPCENDAVQKRSCVQKSRRAKVSPRAKVTLVQKCLRAKVTRSQIIELEYIHILFKLVLRAKNSQNAPILLWALALIHYTQNQKSNCYSSII